MINTRLISLSFILFISACGAERPQPAVPQNNLSAQQMAATGQKRWAWTPVAGTACGNGSATGFGTYPGTDPTQLVIFLQGGGACNDARTCGVDGSMGQAMHINGYNELDFRTEILFLGEFRNSPLYQAAPNATFVYIPYCTGDLHAGDHVADYGVYHRGYRNLGLDLAAILPSFPNLEKVVLAGASAGGYGALYNFYRVQQLVGDVPVSMIDDSGPFLPPPWATPAAAVVEPWGLASTVPPNCDGCLDDGKGNLGLYKLFEYYAHVMPGRRGSLISSLHDTVLADYYDTGGVELAAGLTDLANNHVLMNPDFHVYYVDSSRHVWLGKIGNLTPDPEVAAFLRAQIDNAADWGDVWP